MTASGAMSFLGSGSQKYCTIRLHFSISTPVISVGHFGSLGPDGVGVGKGAGGRCVGEGWRCCNQ
jgi:hypothetical protein